MQLESSDGRSNEACCGGMSLPASSVLASHHDKFAETLDRWARQHDAKLDRLTCLFQTTMERLAWIKLDESAVDRLPVEEGSDAGEHHIELEDNQQLVQQRRESECTQITAPLSERSGEGETSGLSKKKRRASVQDRLNALHSIGGSGIMEMAKKPARDSGIKRISKRLRLKKVVRKSPVPQK